jgi:hypothetical protein
MLAIRFYKNSWTNSWREPPTMGKQLVNFITCGCESNTPWNTYRHKLAELFFYSHEADSMQGILKKNEKKLAQSFNFALRMYMMYFH